MKKKQVLNILLIALPALAVVLTAVPANFQIRFYAGGSAYFSHNVSGFDPILLGYGSWSPMINGLLSILLVVRGILAMGKGKLPRVTGMALAALGASLYYNVMGNPTAGSWVISGLQAVLTAVSIAAKEKEEVA